MSTWHDGEHMWSSLHVSTAWPPFALRVHQCASRHMQHPVDYIYPVVLAYPVFSWSGPLMSSFSLPRLLVMLHSLPVHCHPFPPSSGPLRCAH